MSISMDVEKVARMNPTHDMTAPEIQTTRHPNRFTMALAKGPTKQEPEIQHRNRKYNTVTGNTKPEIQLVQHRNRKHRTTWEPEIQSVQYRNWKCSENSQDGFKVYCPIFFRIIIQGACFCLCLSVSVYDCLPSCYPLCLSSQCLFTCYIFVHIHS